MPKIDLPKLGDNWNTNDIVKWINSRQESSSELLEAVETAISETRTQFDATKSQVEKIMKDQTSLEGCARTCTELRDRLHVLGEAQAKEQHASKKFDEIAVFDQADRRASELASIVRARMAWKEGVKAIESLDEGEPAPENVVFSLQNAYDIFSKHVAVPERGEFLERVKDVFLSWYSTRVVLALQSDDPAEALIPIKNKYDTLHRTEDLNAVMMHYIKDQSKLELNEANSLPDLFMDIQRSVLTNYTRLREAKGWADKVLDHPSQFIANALTETVLSQWDQIRSVSESTIGKTVDEDASGALALRMVLALHQLVREISPPSEEDQAITNCLLEIGNRLMQDVAAGYSKLATSFLNSYANINLGTGAVSTNLEHLSNGLSQLIKESEYLIQVANETFDSLAIVFITPAFRSMYENLVSLLSKFYKTSIEKSAVKDNDILRLISISGQLMSWLERDKKRFKEMLDVYASRDRNSTKAFESDATSEEMDNFEKRISVKAEGDLGIAKAKAELRKLNKRFVTRAVQHLSRPFVSTMEKALKEIREERSPKPEEALVRNDSVHAFSSSPNEFVTSSGVALLSLAHQLSAYSQDSNMATALATVSRTDTVDDVTSWWVEKCAASVQDCFIDGVGEIKVLPSNLARQFSVDYVYLADVFDDLGTARVEEFDELRQTFAELGYINDQQ